MANILIVDDDELILNLLEAILMRKNKLVDKAASSEEALEKFKPGKYDLISIDLRLGDMNGLELCLQIREQDKDVCIISLTGFYDPIFVQYDAAIAGFNAVFKKPLQCKEFIKFLEDHGFYS